MISNAHLQKMGTKELGQLFPIIISEHLACWVDYYQKERQLIIDSFSKPDIFRIDHIGSTAVPLLKAKPTIDILIQVSKKTDTKKIVATFKVLGYQYTKQPDNPPPHVTLVKGYTKNGFKGQAYHVHVRYKGDWDEIKFKDYLIEHRNVAKEYEELKLELATTYKNDREAYTNAKTSFIENVNRMARKTK